MAKKAQPAVALSKSSEPQLKAKMRLHSVEHDDDRNIDVLHFVAVPRDQDRDPYPQDGSDPDNNYAKFAPTAEMTIEVANDQLLGNFDKGEEFDVTFNRRT